MTSTPKPIQISNQTARRFLLNHHFLLPPRQLKHEEILTKTFKRLGCIQFDTINVVGRNADLVLQSRVNGYTPKVLENLLYQDRSLIDGWDKMASIYQTTDWPYFRRHRNRMRDAHHNRSKEAAAAAPEILEAIKENGPMSSIDFKDDRKTDWWWAPTSVSRAAMESLYASGVLGIDHRINTRRVFDLIERLIPADILTSPDPHPTDQEYLEWHILRRLGSMGLASMRSGEYWHGIHQGSKAAKRRTVIKSLLEKGLVKSVAVDNIPGREIYLRTEDFENLVKLPQGELENSKISFIAPLDNLIWNRKFINLLFGFSYTWEVYKPKTQREFGYYVLPVLFQDRFIARVDMKFEKKSNILHLNNWWWETGTNRTPEMESAIREAFKSFLKYLGGDQVKMVRENFTVKRQAGLFESLTKGLK